MSEVLFEAVGGVAVITLNRPEAKNAVTRAVSEAVAGFLDELDRRPDLHVGVLTGAGGTFCSGMDLRAFLQGEVVSLPGRGFGGLTERPPLKPLIAAVEGWALAGGFELVLACDLVVASASARFGLPEVKRGLVPRAGGLLRLPRLVPRAVALEMVLTGEPMSATRAAEVGLVNRVTAEGRALDGARELASAIAANGPLAVATSKEIVRTTEGRTLEEAFAVQRPLAEMVFASEDAREGAAAFTEKRPPEWRNR
ncbi:MAG TPA: crotonase/enoyl-CoA hydratase family protein [Acidimicrobiales bacterium]|nr:crotonase/enoyl-CoA hydratase family protein [Acidimicrobiales bacterium]